MTVLLEPEPFIQEKMLEDALRSVTGPDAQEYMEAVSNGVKVFESKLNFCHE